MNKPKLKTMKTKQIKCPECGGSLRDFIEDGTKSGKDMGLGMMMYLRGLKLGVASAFGTLEKLKVIKKNKKKKK